VGRTVLAYVLNGVQLAVVAHWVAPETFDIWSAAGWIALGKLALGGALWGIRLYLAEHPGVFLTDLEKPEAPKG
jgi:hypothetical protein